MTTRDIMFVGARLMALWVMVASVVELAAAPAMDWGGPGETQYLQLIAVASIALVPLLVAVPLWYRSAWLANRVSVEGDTSLVGGAPVDAAYSADRDRWFRDHDHRFR